MLLRVDVLAMPVGAPVFRHVWQWWGGEASADKPATAPATAASASKAQTEADRVCSLILAFTQFAREINGDSLTQVHFEVPFLYLNGGSGPGFESPSHNAAHSPQSLPSSSLLASSSGMGKVQRRARSDSTDSIPTLSFGSQRSASPSSLSILSSSSSASSTSSTSLSFPESPIGPAVSVVVEQNSHLLIAVFHNDIQPGLLDGAIKAGQQLISPSRPPAAAPPGSGTVQKKFAQVLLSAFESQFGPAVDAVIPELVLLAKDESFAIHDVLVDTVAAKFAPFSQTLHKQFEQYTEMVQAMVK